MQAVILTAGRGDRLRPVTDFVPKALIPFWGKPFVAYILDTLVGLVDEVVLVVGTGRAVQHTLGDNWAGIPLRYVVQPHPGGTGDALLRAWELLDERFLLMLGDTFAPRKTVEAVLEHKGDAVLTLVEVADPYNHARIGIHDGLVVDRIWADDANLVDAGLTVLPRHVCDHLEKLPPRGSELRVLQGVEALIAEGLEVRAVKMVGPWLQYGDHEGVAGVCRVLNQIRPFAGVDSPGPKASVDVLHRNCDIVNAIVFGPGELHDCTVRDSLVYCRDHVVGRCADNEIAVW